MFRYIYPIMTILFLLSSCQENESEETPLFPKGVVGFHVETLQTRGTPTMDLQTVDAFRVIAYQYDGLWDNVRNDGTAQLFMENVAVNQSSPDVWSYSPLQYWPQGKNLSFFAYSPEATLGSAPNQHGLSIAYLAGGGNPVLTYEVPVVVKDQPDLLVCTSSLNDLNRTNSTSGVDVQLQHALTCVDFKATGNGERIIGVKLSGVVGVGQLTLGKQSIDWVLNPDDTAYEYEAGVNQEPLDDNPSSILSDDGYLMMIPQALTDQAMLTLTIDGGGSVPYEQTFQLNAANTAVWQPGQFLEYRFVVTPTSTIMLSPESLILPAQAQSYSSFTVICPEQAQDATWTVKTPTGGWLEICDNFSGVNSVAQPDNFTYSGQGTKILYAFAPAANASSAELTSTIGLEGSVQTILVSQLYLGEAYIPQSPPSGWAGSNIYWVEDVTYPDGGYLTFDDKDVRTHEQYQGVYFMWGSLVALSPYNLAWTGGLWNGASGQVLYIPNRDAATNGGWNPLLNTNWGYIPRLGWTNPSNPNGGGSPLTLSDNSAQSYLIQNHNPQGNVGDICKYITDMGWAPGAKEGRRWRMPTHTELGTGTYQRVGGTTFPVQYSTDWLGHAIYTTGYRIISGSDSPFLPTSGYRLNSMTNGSIYNIADYRPGEAFTYWSSSPDRTFGHGLDFAVNHGQPTSIQGFFQRFTGTTVRCVMENDK